MHVSLSLILKLFHVLAAIWMIAGLVGRTVVMAKAARSRDIQTVCALLPVAEVFEKRMVIPGSSLVILAGLITAWAQGWPILGFLQGSPINWVLVSLLLTLSLVPVIALVFLPAGKRFEAALNHAITQSQVTPELTAAFHDPKVRAGHLYEFAAVTVVVALMVLKPF